MTLDERTLRAAGLPASLISLLVSITKAADRAQAAANIAATANDLSPQIDAATRALQDIGAVPGLNSMIEAVTGRVSQIEAAPVPVTSIEVEGGYLVLVMANGDRVTGPELPDAAGNTALVLTGGSLIMDGPDLIITPPTASIQGGFNFLAIFDQARAEAQS